MLNVTAADYPDIAFFNSGGERFPFDALPVQDLMKALAAGTGTDAAAFTGGRALTLESLDQTMADVLWTDRHVLLFKALRKQAVYAVLDTWNQRSSYGGDWATAMTEGGSPAVSDTDIARMIGVVKYYRDKREVTHVMTLVQSTEAAMAEEETSGTRRILGRVETDLFTGDQTIFPTRIHGLLPIAVGQGGDLVYDAHGGAITADEAYHYLAGVVYKEGGYLTDVYHSPACQADVDHALASAQRFVLPISTDGRVVAGVSQRALATAHGVMNFQADRFIRCGWDMAAPNAGAGPEPPATPTVNSVLGNAGTIYSQENLPAGDYYVRVSNVCEAGESAASAAQSVTLTAGNVIRINVTCGAATATGYRVYLSAKDAADGTDCRFHCEFAKVGDGAGQDLDLDGHWVTGTTAIHLLSLDAGTDALDIRQLLPLLKMDLAIVGPAFPFLLNLYLYLRAKKPNFHTAILNVLPSNVAGWNPLAA